MIQGAHWLFYSPDPEADRLFFRDVLGFSAVDAGEGWLIFGLPPAEMAVHPAGTAFTQHHAGQELLGAVLYLMCDDLAALMTSLRSRGVECSPVVEAPWGSASTVRLPSGGSIGLYRPRHATALHLSGKTAQA